MKIVKSPVFWATLLIVFFDCALAFADDDWSFSRSRSYSGGGSSGPMAMGDFAAGAAVLGAGFALACCVVFFIHTWIIVTLMGANALGLFGFLSFLAKPALFVLLIPPLACAFLGAYAYHASATPDPYGLLLMSLALFLAGTLYFYLVNAALAFISPKAWGGSIVKVFVVFGVALGAGCAVINGSAWFFVFFFACALSAWTAWKLYEKVVARAESRKNALM